MSNTPEETQKALDWAIQQLEFRQKTKLYGKISFVFEGGRITRCTTEESSIAPKMITGVLK